MPCWELGAFGLFRKSEQIRSSIGIPAHPTPAGRGNTAMLPGSGDKLTGLVSPGWMIVEITLMPTGFAAGMSGDPALLWSWSLN